MGEELKKILDKFGLKPKSLSIYQTAFTHRSYLNESKEVVESNERLEFLGDTVLSFIISSFLFEKRTTDTEGELTNLRAYIVKTDSLAKVSEQLALGSLLKLSRGEEMSGGRENKQLLANTFEALLGAIFLDLGLEGAKKFVYSTLLITFGKEVSQGAPKDAKSKLQEIIQGKYQTAPKYKILATTGPDHAKKFTVGVFLKDEQLSEGKGSSKQQAEEDAAQAALSAKAVRSGASLRLTDRKS